MTKEGMDRLIPCQEQIGGHHTRRGMSGLTLYWATTNLKATLIGSMSVAHA